MFLPNLNLKAIKWIALAALIAVTLYYSHTANKYKGLYNTVVSANAKQAALIEQVEAERDKLQKLHEKERQLNEQINAQHKELASQLHHLESANATLTAYLNSRVHPDLNNWLRENFGTEGGRKTSAPHIPGTL